jgi:hypothetical protein
MLEAEGDRLHGEEFKATAEAWLVLAEKIAQAEAIEALKAKPRAIKAREATTRARIESRCLDCQVETSFTPRAPMICVLTPKRACS